MLAHKREYIQKKGHGVKVVALESKFQNGFVSIFEHIRVCTVFESPRISVKGREQRWLFVKISHPMKKSPRYPVLKIARLKAMSNPGNLNHLSLRFRDFALDFSRFSYPDPRYFEKSYKSVIKITQYFRYLI